jgi:saccharopine dehydrogenase (NAD+, L-lysine-forming)
MATVLVLGASGTMGRLIAREGARRDLRLVLAGKRADRLVELASTFDSGQARAAVVDVCDPTTLDPVLAEVDVVLNAVGPFTRLAEPVVTACLRAGVPYVDLANELAAVRALLDRDGEARRRHVPLVTGAGFGVVATETLALMLAHASQQPLQNVWLAAAPAVAHTSRGVRATITEILAQGSPRYEQGRLVTAPFGEGATTLQLPDGQRRVVPAPLGDLIAGQRATGAPNVIAYAPPPAEHSVPASGVELRSVAMAVGWSADGPRLDAHLAFGEGFEASAAIAVDVAVRTAAAPRPGAWTPGQLFGTDLARACGAVVRGPHA